MSDVQGIYRQSQPTPSPFPPYPYFELTARDAVYLLVPHSVANRGVKRFAMFGDGNGMPQDFIGKLRFEHLLDDLKKLSRLRNDEFSSEPVSQTRDPGPQIDRYGSNFGKFLSPKGASFGARALPYDESAMPYHAFEVLKPLTVPSGRAAAWFGEEGGATQYMTSSSVSDLIKNGFLKEIDP